IKDRNSEFKKLPIFSSFITYMRFHTDDLIFIGILLRCIHGFKRLNKFWQVNTERATFSVNPQIPNIKKEDDERITKALLFIQTVKDDSKENPLKTWVSLGLINYYFKQGNMMSGFKRKDFNASSSDYLIRKKQSEAALILVDIINKYNLVPTLNIILEF